MSQKLCSTFNLPQQKLYFYKQQKQFHNQIATLYLSQYMFLCQVINFRGVTMHSDTKTMTLYAVYFYYLASVLSYCLSSLHMTFFSTMYNVLKAEWMIW